MKYINKIYLIYFVGIFFSFSYLYHIVSDTQDNLQRNLEKIFILQAKHFSENIEYEIRKKVPNNLYVHLKENVKLRDTLQENLSLIITPSFKYIYVLYRDESGKFRYLLDGSKEEKGEFNQKLNVDKANWNKVYKTKEHNVIIQQDIQNLWGTYLRPILQNNEVEAIIAIDFSAKLPKSISSVMSPIQNSFLYVFISIAILLLILFIQSIVTLKTKHESITDELTQAYNRVFLRNFLKKIDASQYQIIMFDIDYFKKVNDTYGHKAGDYILSEVAYRIKNVIREDDVLVRFGGEEFLIFVKKDLNDSTHTQTVAHRLKDSIENESFHYTDIIINITASLGVTQNPHNFENITEAIKKADEMLYIAKNRGRNIVIFDTFEAENKSPLSNT